MSFFGRYPIADAPTRPPLDWLIPGVALRNDLQILQGRPGDGKSLLALHWAAIVATGKGWSGWRAGWQNRPQRVIVFAFEDSLEAQATRLWAIAKAHYVTPGALEQRVIPTLEVGPLVEKRPGDPRPHRTILYERLAKEIPDDTALVIFDPLVSLHTGMEENSNEDQQRLAEALRDLARGGRGVLAVHHIAKSADPLTMEAARGAGAIVGAARHVMGVRMMTHQEGMQCNIPSNEQCRYAQIGIAKSNHGPRDRRVWLKLETSQVGNHESPIWTPWVPPLDITPVGFERK